MAVMLNFIPLNPVLMYAGGGMTVALDPEPFKPHAYVCRWWHDSGAGP